MVVVFPVKRRLPFFTIDGLPAFRKPPTKVPITAVAHEFKKLAVAYGSLIDGKILEEDMVRRFFIVESKIQFGVRRLVAALVYITTKTTNPVASASGSVPQPKQASFNFRHAFDSHRRAGRGFHLRGELIAQQMLDVVNQELLMLHFMFETKPDEGMNCFRGWSVADRIQKLEHLFIYVIPISDCLLDCRARFGTAFGPLDARAKSFVVGIEVEEKLVRINFVTCQVSPQHSLEKPRCVADMPARRTHEVSRLNYVVFNLQRRDDLHRARPHLF